MNTWHALPEAPPRGYRLGNLRDLVDGQAAMREMQTEGSEKPFRYILLRSANHVRAYVNRCAHFGVPLAAQQSQLIFKPHQSLTCNVHYAQYHWDTGTCMSGDCEGESLLPIPLQMDADGNIAIAMEDA